MSEYYYYDETNVSTNDSHISSAKCQAVTLASGQNAIRFYAMIDENYADYSKTGFIITNKNYTPTIQGGFQYDTQYIIYKKILSKNKIDWVDVESRSTEFSSKFTGAGLA